MSSKEKSHVMIRAMPRILLPSLNDDAEGFNFLCVLANRVRSGEPCQIDFSSCEALMQNAVAILGGLSALPEGDLSFQWDTVSPRLMRQLRRNGLLKFFGGPDRPKRDDTAVPFRQDIMPDEDAIVFYLTNEWITFKRVHLSDALKDQIVGKTWEIYANAFDHASSQVGIFSCGQHYSAKKLLKLTVVDFGCGIPELVRAHNSDEPMSGADALRWAFEFGNSTKGNRGIPRGLGLALLRSFVKVNKGKLEIFSHDGYACVDETVQFSSRNTPFPGTVVNITFSCDESFYRLSSESANRNSLF